MGITTDACSSKPAPPICLQQKALWGAEATLERFFQAARAAGVASFDVFDTAVRRAVAQPNHVFAQVEQSLAERFGARTANGFAQARIDAEASAREIGWRERLHVETTLEEIYRALPRFWGSTAETLEKARQLELELELAGIEPEPAIQDVYARLRSAGVRTIFVSDVYLGTEVVRGLLTRCGYAGVDGLFVSSAHRKAKWDGSLWGVVAEGLGVDLARIVHIGDNLRVDVEAAGRSGVAAFHWPGRTRHLKAVAPVSRWILPLSRLKVRHLATETDDPSAEVRWARLGRTHGTIIFGAFLFWLAERVRDGIDHVYFCSRDGQVLFKLWQELIEPRLSVPTASYLYISRRSLNLPQLDPTNARMLEFLTSGGEERSVRTYLERAALLDMPEVVARAEALFGGLDHVVAAGHELERLRAFFRGCGDALARTASRADADAQHYLEQEGLFAGGHRVLVDLGWRGSLQRSLNALLRRKGASTCVSGLYYGLTRDAGINRGAAGWMEGMISNDFAEGRADFELRQMVTFLEQAHGADHGSVWSYAQTGARIEPVFRPSEVEQAQYERMIRPFQDAAADELRQIFSGHHPLAAAHLTPESARAALVDLCLYPSLEEVRTLATLRHLDGFEHSGPGLPITAALPEPSRSLAVQVLEKHTWISGTLLNWLQIYPDWGDTVREIARLKHPDDERWISQFGRPE